jgi:hypothetical protein
MIEVMSRRMRSTTPRLVCLQGETMLIARQTESRPRNVPPAARALKKRYEMKRTTLAFACAAFSALAAAQNTATVIGAGYALPNYVKVAPGQVITFFVHGIGAGLTEPAVASSLPLPTSLAGISASFTGQCCVGPVPILGVEPVSAVCAILQPGCGYTYTAVTVQIPFNIYGQDPTQVVGNLPPPGQIDFSENGVLMASMVLDPWVDQVHILRRFSFDPLNLPPGNDPMLGAAAVTHADGSDVFYNHPAKAGEVVAVYAVGLGAPHSAKTGDAPEAPIPVTGFRVSYDPRPNALASRPSRAGETGPGTAAPEFVGLVPGGVGLYQINVKIPALPAGAEPCNPETTRNQSGIVSNLTINIFGNGSVDGVGICVDPGS